jgi:hypothetical protein
MGSGSNTTALRPNYFDLLADALRILGEKMKVWMLDSGIYAGVSKLMGDINEVHRLPIQLVGVPSWRALAKEEKKYADKHLLRGDISEQRRVSIGRYIRNRGLPKTKSSDRHRGLERGSTWRGLVRASKEDLRRCNTADLWSILEETRLESVQADTDKLDPNHNQVWYGIIRYNTIQ